MVYHKSACHYLTNNEEHYVLYEKVLEGIAVKGHPRQTVSYQCSAPGEVERWMNPRREEGLKGR